jgi:hypothetical protein
MEPVAWMWRNTKTGARGVYFEDPEQFFYSSAKGDYEWPPLYAHPPRTALTSESREALHELVACEDMKLEVQSLRSDPYYITEADAMELRYEERRDKAWERARAIEAAHGIGKAGTP